MGAFSFLYYVVGYCIRLRKSFSVSRVKAALSTLKLRQSTSLNVAHTGKGTCIASEVLGPYLKENSKQAVRKVMLAVTVLEEIIPTLRKYIILPPILLLIIKIKNKMKQFIKRYYSITIFSIVMLFFVYVFSYTTYTLYMGHKLSPYPVFNTIMLILCILAAILYAALFIVGLIARFKREDD